MAKIKQLQWLNSKLQMRILWGVVLVSSWFLMRCSQNMPNWFSVGTGLQNSEPDILNGLSWALIYDIFSFILPVMVSVPSVLKFYDEVHGKRYRQEVIRTGKIRYVFCKVADSFFTAVLVMILTIAIYTMAVYIYAWIYDLPVACARDSVSFSDKDIYTKMLAEHKGWVVYLIKIVFVSVAAGIWAMLGSSLVVFIKNKRVAILGPFIIRAILDMVGAYLDAHYHTSVLWMYKLQLSSGISERVCGGMIEELIYLLVIGMLCMFLVYVGMERIYRKQG